MYAIWYIKENDRYRKEERCMLWQKQATPGFFDGPGAPVDLRTMQGMPARLHFADGSSTSKMISLPCTVVKVDRSEMLLEMVTDQGLPHADTAVILEVVQTSALVQCFTLVRATGPGTRLAVRTPGRPHITQRRRFPRVDLYVGVTIRTPERNIEPIPAQMINLSMDGAACVLIEPIAPNAALSLDLSAIGMHPADVGATAMRCAPTPTHLWLVGIKFTGLQPEQELYLGKYISDVIQLMQSAQ